MAKGVLTRIAFGASQGAKTGLAQAVEGRPPAGGIVGSVFRGAVGGLLADSKTGGSRTAEASDQPTKIDAKLNQLIPFFASISQNVQAIARHIGATVATMKDIQEDSRQQHKRDLVAQEEAATEGLQPATDEGDATPISGNPQGTEEDACKCDEQGKVEESEGRQASGFLSMLGGAGQSLLELVGSMGMMFTRAMLKIGARILVSLFPVGLPIAIASAIGYGIYKYFTDDKFKKSVDSAFATAKEFAVKNVFEPLIDAVKRLVGGVVGFLGNLWEMVTGAVSRAINYVSDKASDVKNAAVAGAKNVGAKVANFFGFGGSSKEAAPAAAAAAGQPAASGSIPPKKTATPAAAPQIQVPAGGSGGSAATPVAAKPAAQAAGAPSPVVSSAGAGVTSDAPTGDPSKFASLVQKADPGVVLDGFHQAFTARLAGLAEEFQKITGKKLRITSGFRAREKQEQLYREKGGVGVAKPGTSLHESGVAIDIQKEDANRAAELGLMDKYLLIRPLLNWSVKPEPWHVEPMERKGLKTAPDGNLVAGGNGKPTSPESGKALPAEPKTGSQLAAASSTNSAINDKRQQDAGAKTTIVYAPQMSSTTVNHLPTPPKAQMGVRSFS